MNPDQNGVAPPPVGQPTLSPQPSTQLPQASQASVPFYRSYWVFGAIYVILPPIIGLVLLLTGDIYRKAKDGQMQPIHRREKITLTVIALLLWTIILFPK